MWSKQLPDWFALKHYEQLNHITAHRFIFQIYIRTCILESLNKHSKIKGMPEKQEFILFMWDSYIQKGTTILEPNDIDYLEEKDKEIKKNPQ